MYKLARTSSGGRFSSRSALLVGSGDPNGSIEGSFSQEFWNGESLYKCTSASRGLVWALIYKQSTQLPALKTAQVYNSNINRSTPIIFGAKKPTCDVPGTPGQKYYSSDDDSFWVCLPGSKNYWVPYATTEGRDDPFKGVRLQAATSEANLGSRSRFSYKKLYIGQGNPSFDAEFGDEYLNENFNEWFIYGKFGWLSTDSSISKAEIALWTFEEDRIGEVPRGDSLIPKESISGLSGNSDLVCNVPVYINYNNQLNKNCLYLPLRDATGGLQFPPHGVGNPDIDLSPYEKLGVNISLKLKISANQEGSVFIFSGAADHTLADLFQIEISPFIGNPTVGKIKLYPLFDSEPFIRTFENNFLSGLDESFHLIEVVGKDNYFELRFDGNPIFKEEFEVSKPLGLFAPDIIFNIAGDGTLDIYAAEIKVSSGV